MRRFRPLVLALAAAACGSPAEAPLQGYAEGEYVRVGAPFAGTLVRLDVQRGSRVEAGAPLFALEAENESAARREAEDRLKNAQAQLENLRKGRRPTEIDAVRAQLAQAQAAAAFSVAAPPPARGSTSSSIFSITRPTNSWTDRPMPKWT